MKLRVCDDVLLAEPDDPEELIPIDLEDAETMQQVEPRDVLNAVTFSCPLYRGFGFRKELGNT